MTGQTFDVDPAGMTSVIADLSSRRVHDPKIEPDYWFDLEIRGYKIGDNKVRWSIEQDGDTEYDEQYVADVLEKVVLVIRGNNGVTDVFEGRCPHDGQTCTHDCHGDECWRELDGS